MSLFTFFITDKKNLTAAKKELFKIRQNSLSFIEDNSILMDTKLFQDQFFFQLLLLKVVLVLLTTMKGNTRIVFVEIIVLIWKLHFNVCQRLSKYHSDILWIISGKGLEVK